MRLRSEDKHHLRKSADQKAQISPVCERNERLPDLCFSICRFSEVVFILRAQPHAQSLFLFPIVVGINTILSQEVFPDRERFFLISFLMLFVQTLSLPAFMQIPHFQYQQVYLNPLWGNQPVSIDSDLVELQPYVFVLMVTAVSPSFVCMHWETSNAVVALKIPLFCCCRKSCRLAPLKLRSPLFPQWGCTHFSSLCLVWWSGSERCSSALFQLRSRRQRSLKVYLSHFLSFCVDCRAGRERFGNARFHLWSRRPRGCEVYLSTLLRKLGSLSVIWRTWDAMQEATDFVVLALCTHSSW